MTAKQPLKSQPKLTVIDNVEGIDSLIEYLADKDLVSYDCETTGLEKTAEIIGVSVCASEDEAFYVILSVWDTESQTLVKLPTHWRVKSLIQALEGKALVMHNAIFDCIMAEAYFKVRLIDSLHTDTMVLAHLLDENRKIGLKPLGAQYFGQDATTEADEMKASVIANGGTTTKKDYQMYKADPYILGKYGAQDAMLTYKLFNAMVPELLDQGLDKFFYEDECMPLLKGPTYDLNNTGVKVDMNALATLGKQLQAECLEAKEFVYREITPHIADKYPGTNKKNQFNIGSSSQLAWLLFGKLGLEFGSLTKGGKDVARKLNIKVYTAAGKRDFIQALTEQAGEISQPAAEVNGKKVSAKKYREPWNYIAVDKKTLAKLAPKLRWVERLLEYQRKNKILTTYVKGISERVRYGVLHGSFLQTGTTSGRYASRNPNMQNIPRDDKRVKACLVSRPGKVFVGSDFSQLEVRVFASVSGDKALLDAFKNGEDFYSRTGMGIYDKYDCIPMKDGSPQAFGVKYKELRNKAKVIVLARTYGASDKQLANQTGSTEDEMREAGERYFENFPDVEKMMLNSHEMAKKDGVVYSLYGRPRRIPEAKRIPKMFGDIKHADLDYEWRGFLNLAVNHRIQSTAASVCNRAMIQFYNNIKQLGIDCKIVMQVHDEIIVECPESDAADVSALLQDAMEHAVELPGVSLEAIPHTAKNIGDLK